MIRAIVPLSILFLALCHPAVAPGQEISIADARRISFDADWRFLKGDAPGAEQPGFNDAAWRRLDLPHDWAIEGPFDPKYEPHNGALPFYGVGWYRKHFTLPPSARGKYLSLEFDGAMANSRVWVNGVEAGGRPYGYIGFSVDLTPQLRFDGENVVAVRLAPEDQSSRWYPGAGIYRHVWLDVTGPVHVDRWGTYITTPSVSEKTATIKLQLTIRNRTNAPAPVFVSVHTEPIQPGGGRGVAAGFVSGSTPVSVPAGSVGTSEYQIQSDFPQLWDLDQPNLYRAKITLQDSARKVVDSYETVFGIRTIEFDRTNGFRLNGRRVPIQGVCNHHDLGALGTAVNRRSIERQVEIMKRMGANAIRTSHNPPAPELLDAADRLGMLVLDEAFDEWRTTKVKNGHGTYFDEWGARDLTDMIRRDRNHPSVIMWSIGNEVPDQGTPAGRTIARQLTGICHREDPTRPVTAGFNQIDDAIKNGLTEEVDIVGLNYGARRYESLIKAHPNWTVLATETASTVSSRDVYHLPIEKYQKHPSHQLSSYDIIAPPWAYAPDVEFDALDRSPSVLGEFVWTGFDYLGEPTPYFNSGSDRQADWPARSSYFGIVDLAGIPKDRFFLYQSRWSTAPMVHVLPHWNWADRAGRPIPVFVYTNAEEVELSLNGKSLGTKKKGAEPVQIPVDGRNITPAMFATPYRIAWNVPWEAGTLRVVARSGGREVASDERRTAGPPARVTLLPDRRQIRADGDDLSFVTVRIEDKDGTLCPAADNLVRFSVTGAGTLRAVDNGNAATTESFQASERKAFSGMALVIVRSVKGNPGEIRVTAESDGLKPAAISLTTER
jgi:beta-galactosidase